MTRWTGLAPWVFDLDLVDGGRNGRRGHKLLQVFNRVVRDPDGSHLARRLRALPMSATCRSPESSSEAGIE